MNREDLTQILDRLDQRLDTIEKHIERVEPLILEYHTSKHMKKRLMDWMKTTGMVIALALSGLTLREKLQAQVVKSAPISPE